MNRRSFFSMLAGAAGTPLVPWRGLIEPLIVLPAKPTLVKPIEWVLPFVEGIGIYHGAPQFYHVISGPVIDVATGRTLHWASATLESPDNQT